MDHEQEYNAALEQAEKELKTCGSMDCDAARLIFRLFPQLRESEDEETRQFLIHWINQNGIGAFRYIDISWKERCIPYLEKQKEQKAAEKQDYSELNDLERAIHRGFLAAGVENVPVGVIKETAQDCLAQMKPAEWSEEDEAMRENLLYLMLENNSQDSWEGTYEWLKSLRPQTKVEWSEEDEKQIAQIERIVKNAGCAKMLQDKIHNWLKSIRPSWKPSEEQPVEGLKEAAEKYLDGIFGKGKHEDFYVQLFKAGAEWQKAKMLKLIETRISKIVGDAQPNPVLRIELQGIIDKIK